MLHTIDSRLFLVNAIMIQAVLVKAVLIQIVLIKAVLIQAVLIKAVLIQTILIQTALAGDGTTCRRSQDLLCLFCQRRVFTISLDKQNTDNPIQRNLVEILDSVFACLVHLFNITKSLLMSCPDNETLQQKKMTVENESV